LSPILGHFVRVESDSTWETGNYSPSLTDWKTIDQIVSQMINGDMGGTWAPLTPIEIGGSGLLLVGPLLVVGEGSLTSTASGAYQCCGESWPQLGPDHVGRERVIVTPCSSGRSSLPFGAVPFFYGLQSVAQTFLFVNGVGQTTEAINNEIYIPLRVHNGATLSQVEVSYAIAGAHTPVNMPQFRVVRVDIDGDQVLLTSSAAANAAGSPQKNGGYMSPPAPTSASAYYNGGEAQYFTIPCDQYNIVDVTQYSYFLQIIDETGSSGYPYQLVVTPPVQVATNLHTGAVTATALIDTGGSITLTYSSGTFTNGEIVTITGTGLAFLDGTSWPISSVTGSTFLLDDSTYQTGTPTGGLITAGRTFEAGLEAVIDGTTVTTKNAPVLVKDQLDAYTNGLWTATYGGWNRSAVPLTQGMIVPVAYGTANAGTYWQLLNYPGSPPNVSSWSPGEAYSPGQQALGFSPTLPLIFTCTVGGTTAASEPTWPTAVGGTVTDGSVTWQAAPYNFPGLTFAAGPTSGASITFPVSGQFVAQSTIFINAAVSFVDITEVAFQ
jgi:hypothetical protein